jgi:hypothetical protein
MSLYTIKPLDDRTGFKGQRRQSPFESSWTSTRELLARELRQLHARNVILEVDVLPGQIRLDGELYAAAKVQSPAVRLHFDTNDGHVSFPADRFTGWQDNVRAIALAMEALRKIERYGIGRGDEQYSGFLQLEAGQGVALGGMARDQAERALAEWGGPFESPAGMRVAYRRARAAAHPDRSGDRSAWELVENAARVLGLTS